MAFQQLNLFDTQTSLFPDPPAKKTTREENSYLNISSISRPLLDRYLTGGAPRPSL